MKIDFGTILVDLDGREVQFNGSNFHDGRAWTEVSTRFRGRDAERERRDLLRSQRGSNDVLITWQNSGQPTFYWEARV